MYNEDLSGTEVRADKPVVVLSGSMWSSVGQRRMGDNLIEQMPATDTWGTQFFTVPLSTRTSGDIFRVVGMPLTLVS